MQTRWTGCGTALVTPFTRTGALDETAIKKLVRRQIEGGAHFLVPCGTTGESPSLSNAEKLRVVELVVDEANGAIPVLAGAGSYSTSSALELIDDMDTVGASGILSVTPYYNKPTQDGLFQHFKFIPETVDIPQILYNVPGRTACDMLPETIIQLASVDNIIGVKEATADLTRVRRIREGTSSDFLLLSGDDETTKDFILSGGDGVISVTANVAPEKMSKMCVSALEGNVEEAGKIDKTLVGLHTVSYTHLTLPTILLV